MPGIETLTDPFYARLGPADAGLAALARPGDTFLTGEGALYGMMMGHGIKLRNFWHEVDFEA